MRVNAGCAGRTNITIRRYLRSPTQDPPWPISDANAEGIIAGARAYAKKVGWWSDRHMVSCSQGSLIDTAIRLCDGSGSAKKPSPVGGAARLRSNRPVGAVRQVMVGGTGIEPVTPRV